MAEQDLTDHIKAYQAKFKVGHRVQVLNTAIYETNGHRIVDKRGKTGVVKKVTRKDYSYSHYEYYVAWDDGSQANYYMAEQDLKASAQRRLSLENEQPKDASSAGSNSAQATSASDATNTISSQNAVTYKNGQQVFVKVNRDGRKETRIGMIIGVKPGAQGEAYQVQFVDGSILNNVFANDLLAR
ncbi:hypothetical protein ACJQWY_04700 [Weissella kandleri]|uniref:hypothetical protein n=1 Tax=Weissella kandleri TaxID=1616 RepID=UPI00387EAC89